MLQDLLEAEEREALEQKHKEEVEREFRRRIETHDSLMRQMEERRVKLRQEAEEDARYKEQVLTKKKEDTFHKICYDCFFFVVVVVDCKGSRRWTFRTTVGREEAIKNVAIA